jgi:hypothetical protein
VAEVDSEGQGRRAGVVEVDAVAGVEGGGEAGGYAGSATAVAKSTTGHAVCAVSAAFTACRAASLPGVRNVS